MTAATTALHASQNQTVDVALAVLLMAGGVVGAQFGAVAGERLKAEGRKVLLVGGEADEATLGALKPLTDFVARGLPLPTLVRPTTKPHVSPMNVRKARRRGPIGDPVSALAGAGTASVRRLRRARMVISS